MQIKTYNEILGQLIRKLKADSNLTDLNPGSVLRTLLEAVAQNDFENAASVLSILQLSSVDSVSGPDLDKKGSEFGIVRIPARRSSGEITIYDPSIIETNSTLFVGKPAPIKRQTVVYLTDASEFNPTGTIYIGRDSIASEMVSYSQKLFRGSFWELVLTSPLLNDHFITDIVEDSKEMQDRIIPIGTRMVTRSTFGDVEFRTTREATLIAGKRSITNIPVESVNPGFKYNISSNKLSEFVNPPFGGASIIQVDSFINGRDSESDQSLRDRIKSHTEVGLTKGTVKSILNSVIGLNKPEEGEIISASYSEEEPAIVWVDNGTILPPNYSGIPVDSIIESASGTERLIKLNQYPISRPVLISAEGPFQIRNSFLRIVLDESNIIDIEFKRENFILPDSLSVQDIASHINTSTNKLHARVKYNRIHLSPSDANISIIEIQVPNEDFIEYFKFNVDRCMSLLLYKNLELLSPISKRASVTSIPIENWLVKENGTLIVSVDGTPSQTISITEEDFSYVPFSYISVEEWARVLNTKISGATITPNFRTISISSNLEGSDSSIEILGGTLFSKMFVEALSYGYSKDYILNRMSGHIKLLTPVGVGDKISAGLLDARSVVSSKAQKLYSFVNTSDGTVPELLLAKDATIRKSVSPEVEVSIEDLGSVMKVSISSDDFLNAQINDWIYISNYDATLPGNRGHFQIIKKESNWVEVLNPTVESQIFVTKKKDEVVVFGCEGFPIKLSIEGNNSIEQILYYINENKSLDGYRKKDSVKISFKDGSNIGTPVSSGTMKNFMEMSSAVAGGDSQIGKSHSRGLYPLLDFSTSMIHNDEISTPLSPELILPFSNYLGIFSEKWASEIYRVADVKYPIVNKDYCLALSGYNFHSSDNLLLRVGPNVEHAIKIPMSRSCQVKTEVESTSNSFSAWDRSGELGSDFSSIVYWDKFNFEGFKVHFRAKNFYSSSSGTQFIMRAKEYGINGEKIKLSFITPIAVNTKSQISSYCSDSEILINYTIGSGELKSIFLSNGDLVSIYQNGLNYKMEFSGSLVDFSSVEVGNILSVTADSGLPNNWLGTFTVKSSGVNFLEVNNLLGTSTFNGSIQSTLVSAREDKLEQSLLGSITFNPAAIELDAKAFQIFGSGNLPFVVYFNLGTPLIPNSYSTNEIEITNVLVGDSAEVVAQKVHQAIVSNWGSQFNATAVGSNISYSNVIVGNYSGPSDTVTPTGFTFSHSPYVPEDSLEGRYFSVATEKGLLSIWYSISSSPTITSDYLVVVNYAVGDSASVIASKTKATIDLLNQFTTSVVGDELTLINGDVGLFLGTTVGTAGFLINETLGSNKIPLSISRASGIRVFSLVDNDSTTIISNLNKTPYIEATVLVEGTIDTSTKDEPLPVAHNHQVGGSYIRFYDAENSVQFSQKTNPNFELLNPMLLEVYPQAKLSNIINLDQTVGEYFKLVPFTQSNVYDYLDSKTISSLPLLIDVSLGDAITLHQKEPGSEKFIEISGEANSVSYKTSSDVAIQDGKESFQIPVSSSSLQSGDVVKMETSNIIPKIQSLGSIVKDDNFAIINLAPLQLDIPSYAEVSILDLGNNQHALTVEECGTKISFTRKYSGTIRLFIQGILDVTTTDFAEFEIDSELLAGLQLIISTESQDFSFLVPSGTKQQMTTQLLTNIKLNLEFTSIVYVSPIVPNLFSKTPIGSKVEFSHTPFLSMNRGTIFEVSRNSIKFYSPYSNFQGPFNIYNDISKEVSLKLKPILSVASVLNNTVTTKEEHRLLLGSTIIDELGNSTTVSAVTGTHSFAVVNHILGSYISEPNPHKVIVQRISKDLFALVFSEIMGFDIQNIEQQDRLLFSSRNFKIHGEYEILSVSDRSIIFKNSSETDLSEILGGVVSESEVQWTHNSNVIKGSVGTFSNLSVGMSIRKFSDDYSKSVIISRFINNQNQIVSPELATQVIVSSRYLGSSSFTVFFARNDSEESFGRVLSSHSDIQIFKYWGVDVGDEIVINSSLTGNKGTFKIVDLENNVIKYENPSVINEGLISFLVNSDSQNYFQLKKIENIQVNLGNRNVRDIFVSPVSTKDTIFKSGSSVSITKLGFNNYAYGSDAFKIVEGLVLEAQRTIDGYQGNTTTYPGVKAAGAHIEVLPPIARLVRLSLDVEINDSFKNSEVFSNIKAGVINYIGSLPVGVKISTSSITAVVMKIYGVTSVRIIFPDATFIVLGEGEKAYATQESIEVF